MVDISTTPESVSYTLNNQPMTVEKLAEWMKNAIEAFGDGDPILVRPDAQTTFATVFKLTELLKGSGVKHIEIIAEHSRDGLTVTTRSLNITSAQLKHERYTLSPPPQ